MNYILIATTTFGLEAVARREIETLGYRVIKTENGKIVFEGDERAVVRANLWLRCASRIQICAAEYKATTFEELFRGAAAVRWDNYIEPNGRFHINASSIKSKLSSVPAIQRVGEKAIAESLKRNHNVDVLPETGTEHTIKFTLLKDRVTLTLDTSGNSLHMRGYRANGLEAPLKENVAAALIELSFWNERRMLIDPCCGSGTIPIEAAMIGMNIAPGLNRHFVSEDWSFIDRRVWADERKKAYSAIDYDKMLNIYASDISSEAIETATVNAMKAGVDEVVRFNRANISRLESDIFADSFEEIKINWGAPVIVTNLPYGKRIGNEKEIKKIYSIITRLMSRYPELNFFMITADLDIEKSLKKKANRRRKLYNGNIETTYYQYHGTK